MELGSQIRKYRTKAGFSQEQLAEKVFVTRQTISNWENDRSYPDIRSLVLLSEVFQVSLDQLIKGDLEKMKKEIDRQEYDRFHMDSIIFTVLFIALLILPIPLVRLFKWTGMAIYVCLFGIGMYYALRLEKYKKKFNIQTYREIVAFSNGESLDAIESAREEGKRPYQKIMAAVLSAAAVVGIALILNWIINLLGH